MARSGDAGTAWHGRETRPQHCAIYGGILGRGVTYWDVTGGFSGQKRYLVTCTITRPQVAELKRIAAEVDMHAFVTITLGQQALGSGFMPLYKEDAGDDPRQRVVGNKPAS